MGISDLFLLDKASKCWGGGEDVCELQVERNDMTQKTRLGMFHLENSMGKDESEPALHCLFPSSLPSLGTTWIHSPSCCSSQLSFHWLVLQVSISDCLPPFHLDLWHLVLQFSQHQLSIASKMESLLFIFPRIKNVSPAEAYQDFCLAFTGKKTLTHLTLEGSVHSEKMLLLLCETLKHLRCNLHYLR